MLQHPYKDNGQYPYIGVHHYLYMGKEVKVVLVNNATYVRIAKTVLLPSTTYKAYLSSTDYKKNQQLKKRLDISSIMHVLEIPIY
jgi:conserved domain protein